jgi:L-asparaginase / beta-aspartyl-peptidase
MRHSLRIMFILLLWGTYFNSAFAQPAPITIVIHGGAGTIRKSDLSPQKEAEIRKKLQESLRAGYHVLDTGGTSLMAVITAIRILEDSPLFNAGKGAVFTHDGKNELDAAIMDGATLNAGAVAGVTVIKNPISAAYAVMKDSPHVLLAGKGAEQFAEKEGLEIVDPSYFYTEERYRSLQHAIESEDGQGLIPEEEKKFGTVGCVALDRYGNLAAGTSTGGLTNKKYGRIGDSPIIGAGTYADNNSCAISGTGIGEYFMRKVVAYDIAAKIKYLGLSLKEAAHREIVDELKPMGGDGGVIGLDRHGNFTMEFNTEGMYRGFIQNGHEPEIYLYRDQN